MERLGALIVRRGGGSEIDAKALRQLVREEEELIMAACRAVSAEPALLEEVRDEPERVLETLPQPGSDDDQDA